MKNEARQVAILLDPETGRIVGKLYLWETGEADPMWIKEEVLDVIVEPLPSENPKWENWTLADPAQPED